MKCAVFGEAILDIIEHNPGTMQPFIGGSPFNVARSFAKQGVDVSYVAPLSHDRYGQQFFDYASAEGIILPENNRSALPTSIAVVYTDAHGQPDYSLYRKGIADLDIDAATLLAHTPDDIDLFHTGSLALVPAMVDTLEQVFTTLKGRGVYISVDVNMRKGVESNNADYIAAVNQLIPFADIVKVSDEDLTLLEVTGSPLNAARHVLSQLNDGLVLLTEGEHGATAITATIECKKPVHPPRQFVDAVGAGDTFFSAFLAELGLSQGLQKPWLTEHIEQALRFGLLAATLNVEQQGCQPPTRQTVLQHLS